MARRPWALPLAAATLMVVEGVVALLSGPSAVLAALAIVLVPGLSVAPLLPRELRAPAVRVAIVPLVGISLSSLLVISLATLGIALTATTIRAALFAVAFAGIASRWHSRPPARPALAGGLLRSEAATLLLLLAALVVAASLQVTLLGAKPVPGPDWGHYLLYTQEIREQGSLDLENELWMGGQPFLQDPGAPALYAAYVLLSEQPTSALVQGIWPFALLTVVSVFVLAAVPWGAAAGVAAAALYSAIPISLELPAWHGVAHQFALMILPLPILAVAMALRGRGDTRWAAVFGLSLLAVAAAHRLTALFAVAALSAPVLFLVVRRRGSGWRFVYWGALAGAVCGGAVLADLVRRYRDTGRPLDAEYYEVRKITFDFVLRDITTPLLLAGAVALTALVAAKVTRRDPALLTLVGLLAGVGALGYAWLLDVPMEYSRAIYFLPLPLVLAIAVASAHLLRGRGLLLVPILVAYLAIAAHDLAPGLRSFYGSVNSASLVGLGHVDKRAGPNDLIVTDACWAFPALWLLQRPVIATLDESQIQPRAEVASARLARRILYGGPAARKLASEHSARFALVDPNCSHDTGEYYRPPDTGRIVYASQRLVVLEFGAVRAP